MGTVLFWDVRGAASGMRARLEEKSVLRAWYKRLPPWTFRAGGVWCFVFGIGQLIYFAVTMPGH
jgi:hypothetical protein